MEQDVKGLGDTKEVDKDSHIVDEVLTVTYTCVQRIFTMYFILVISGLVTRLDGFPLETATGPNC